MRTANALGIKTVAVYSDADASALHTKSADEAVFIGPPAVAESYLQIEKIIDAAKATGSDAIHPGYGFLSENAAFADACEKAGIVFVGPSTLAIDLMGDKARAKRAMIEAGVPCVPGYQGEDQETDTLIREAAGVGYPLMIKAAAGGGGRGMRLVEADSEVANAIETARSEALNAFGSAELIIEKAIISPRHVEIQVFGDSHGNVVYLGERDCSVQRRHQKVIEEAPCPVMTPALRQQMGEAAVAAAKAVDYVGAGTVEFLLGADGEFYFLEMNTRLQVEHPVTEEITGLDLVQLQLNIAAGDALGFTQDDVELNGHSMEIRLYAEDPENDFLPSTGHIDLWIEPTGEGVRVDGGIETGGEVSPFYDPMLAKVIATGSNREEARSRLVRSLRDSCLFGPATNRDFLIDALERDAFISGEATTAFIGEEYGEAGFATQPATEELCIAAMTQYLVKKQDALASSAGVNDELLNWASADLLGSVFIYKVSEKDTTFVVRPTGTDQYSIAVGDAAAIQVEVRTFSSDRINLKIDGEPHHAAYLAYSDGLSLSISTHTTQFTVEDISAGESLNDGAGGGMVVSPMHGQLLEVFVSEGDDVSAGDRLAVLEAMKMQHEIVAEVSGKVVSVQGQANTQIAQDAVILEIEPASDD